MKPCEYESCDNPAEFFDEMGDKVCRECMEREVNESDAKPEDFEQFCLIM